MQDLPVLRRAASSTLLSLVVALTALLFSSASLAEVSYWRVSLDRVTVVANGSARRCHRLAAQFLAFERVLRDLANLGNEFTPLPIRIYALTATDAHRYFYTDEDYQREDEEHISIFAKYMPNSDFNIAAIVDSGNTEDSWQSVLLLYAQNTLAFGPTRGYPMWYQLGVSNILNGSVIENNGSVQLNRAQQFEPLNSRAAKKQARYDLAALLQMTSRSFANKGDIREFVSRARDWAQFGLLTTAEHRTQFLQLAELMRQGMPANDAVAQAFGMTLEELSMQFENEQWRRDMVSRLPAPTDLPEIADATRLEEGEVRPALELLRTRARLARSK